MIDRPALLRLAAQAVTRAADLCQRVQSGVTPAMIEKKDKSPVTVADFGSQALVAELLAAESADIPLVGEEDAAALRESDELRDRVVHEVATTRHGPTDPDAVLAWIDHGNADATSERFWTLDPIDGTKGFLRGEQYAIALALVEEGTPVLAALCCPNLEIQGETGVVLTAQRGGGTELASLPGTALGRVQVSAESDPARSRFCESVESGHSDHDHARAIADALGMTRDSVRLDSQAKYAIVASGGAEIYLRLPTRRDYVERIWDHAAGALCVTAAGGTVTDIDGKALEFSHGRGLEKNRGIVATSGPAHEATLAAIAKLGI